ncbi:hypothetical protein BDF20DRAFT_810521, partial [Mycotypha africana]|uniref:uncharacterized protein n=1 Tax=Mycotypha africana TaxID=64632 RepID=UPI002301CBB4
AFGLYDRENKGAIDHAHFAPILKSLNIETNDEKLNVMLNKIDKNHDGLIDFEEFVLAMTKFSGKRRFSRRMSRHESDELRLCFAKFDQNGDGLISTDELKEVMKGLGEELTDQEIDQMMEEADANNDGFIDFNEFRALMPSSSA